MAGYFVTCHIYNLVETRLMRYISTCTLGSCTPSLWMFLLVLSGQITLKLQRYCQASSSGLGGTELSAGCFGETAERQTVKFSLCHEILEKCNRSQCIRHLQKDKIQMEAQNIYSIDRLILLSFLCELMLFKLLCCLLALCMLIFLLSKNVCISVSVNDPSPIQKKACKQ